MNRRRTVSLIVVFHTTAIIGGPSDNNQVGAAWIFAAEAVPPRRRGVRH
ncbi:MAG TPA: hypothetical protein VLC46_00760 [Thermoanaerobaculia bacterium]|nr:hypothetical protein [Thermoanaerobaculia bacterium]